MLSLAASGYSIGESTAINNMQRLHPGKAIIFQGQTLEQSSYYKYGQTYEDNRTASRRMESNLTDVTLSILENLKEKAAGGKSLYLFLLGLIHGS